MKSEGSCNICGRNLVFKWNKFSSTAGKDFIIYQCKACQLWQIFPVPSQSELNALYETSYFSKRSERGYDNYAGNEVKKSVRSTFEKNLRDLDFYSWEKCLPQNKRALEIGSAAGHFVEYLQERDWNITGIDISQSMVDAGKRRGLNLIQGNFLDYQFNAKFDLIVLWATLEHLPDPNLYIKKINSLLKPEGRLYLTTTNTGFWAKIYGKYWRYLNVPEHIFYFNRNNLKILFHNENMKLRRSFTYGSGFTAKKNSSRGYKFVKKFFDFSAKFFHSGDMIVLEVIKA